MITASEIAHLRPSPEPIEKKYAQLPAERSPVFLTWKEFDEICEWKLRQQYERQRPLRKANVEVIEDVTKLALTITHGDPDYELELRIRILRTLRGVGTAIASAILTLVYPDEYAIIDFRCWRQLFDKERRGFSTSEYKRYMQKIRSLSQELGWTPREVDGAIWRYDYDSNTS